MVIVDNLASILRSILISRLPGESKEWRVLGQEGDGGLVVGWLQSASEDSFKSHSCIGIYYRHSQDLQILYKFKKIVNIVQASVNSTKSALVYVTKNNIDDVNASGNESSKEQKTKMEVYQVYVIHLRDVLHINDDSSNENCPSEPLYLGIERSMQTFAQFLYRSKQQPGDIDRFLVLIHNESVSLYHFRPIVDENNVKILHETSVSSIDCVVRTFTWAQWDPVHQSLFYIHFRKPAARLVEGDEDDETGTEAGKRHEGELAPTLSGLQFHDSLPHETVLNIPLNLPLLPKSKDSVCSIYEDDVIPFRVHDCSLDLTVVSDPRGMVCICHHYLYQPVKPPISQEEEGGREESVHFAYSVTLLHHGCVVHCVAPGIPWNLARRMRPSFSLYGEQHMLVHAPGLFTHLLDIGLAHEPCCHILLDSDAISLPVAPDTAYLVALLSCGESLGSSGPSKPILTLDLSTLDLIPISIAPAHFLRAFRGGPHGAVASGLKDKSQLLDNQLAILHYVLVHLGNNELLMQLLNCIAARCMDLGTSKLMQEILVGGAYAAAQKNLPTDATPLLSLLPLTVSTTASRQEIKVSRSSLSLTQETLWNTAMMLLSPQQRLVPYRSDMWTRLYESLAASQQRAVDTTCSMDSRSGARFRPSHVVDKLMVSLICYQPEALSRCSTPLSPGGNLVGTGAAMSDVAAITGASRKGAGYDYLPFQEIESCTASKQEHVISVDEVAQVVDEEDFYNPECNANTAKEDQLPFPERDWCTASKQELVLSVNLRELSMHLLKHALRGLSPLHVHAVATRYVASQLDVSRSLCRQLCLAAKVDPRQERDRGFSLVDGLDDARRRLLFWLLECFLLAVESLAFPLPQGFTSFFTFLGYRSLPFSMFMQYSQRQAFQLQIDVMKAIMSDLPDTPEGSARKLRLLQLLPRSRAKRLLNGWSHPASLMVRAREHALHILSGVEGSRGSRGPRTRPGTNKQGFASAHARTNKGFAAFPSEDRVSPLDTFLDLLTAKASLAELDFHLLVDATIASTEDFSA